MGKQTSTIQINGQQYNAATGEKMGKKSAPRNMDGVVRIKKGTAAPTVVVQPKVAVIPNPIVKKPVMDMARTPAKTVVKHKPEPSKTLMRAAVKKPNAATKRRIKTLQPLSPAVATKSLNTKVEVHVTGPDRLKRSAEVQKSHLVKHFTPLTTITPRAAHASAAAVPIASSQPEAARPTEGDLFSQALQHAESHRQAKPAKPRRGHRSLKVAATSLAVLALVGIAAYQNAAAIRLKMASNTAGFAASLPTFKPSGFRLHTLHADSGAVAINYISNSDSRNYQITQKPSNLTSDALRDSFVQQQDSQYQTVEAGGRTIFIYGARNATWVSGGVWYTITSNGSLSNQQLIDLAASL